MVVFFSCLLFSKLRPGRDRELEAALASAATQKERGEPLCCLLLMDVVPEAIFYSIERFVILVVKSTALGMNIEVEKKLPKGCFITVKT